MILYRKAQDHKQPKADRITSKWRVSIYGPCLVEMGQTCGGPFQADKIRDHTRDHHIRVEDQGLFQ